MYIVSNLKGDENGHFEYVLPLSKDKIKFKFLTRKEEKMLNKLSQIEDAASLSTLLTRTREDINLALKEDKALDTKDKKDITNLLSKLSDWKGKITETKTNPFNKMITNTLEMEIVSVNDNTDRSFIHQYVINMRAKDSLMLRRYINENEPGINFEVTINRPEEFGGGSFTTFLEWDDSIFLNISRL